MAIQKIPLKLRGPLYVRRTDQAGGFQKIAGANKFVLNVESKKVGQKNLEVPGTPTKNTVETVESVSLDIGWDEHSKTNFAVGLRALLSSVAAGAVTSEAHTAYKGSYVFLDFLPDAAQAITVKNQDGTVTYAAGTDYLVSRSSLEILSAGTIADASQIKVDYTKVASTRVEALTEAGATFEVVFDALNEGNGNKAVRGRFHRVNFGILSGFEMLQDEFIEAENKAELLYDETKGAGVSGYFHLDVVGL